MLLQFAALVVLSGARYGVAVAQVSMTPPRAVVAQDPSPTLAAASPGMVREDALAIVRGVAAGLVTNADVVDLVPVLVRSLAPISGAADGSVVSLSPVIDAVRGYRSGRPPVVSAEAESALAFVESTLVRAESDPGYASRLAHRPQAAPTQWAVEARLLQLMQAMRFEQARARARAAEPRPDPAPAPEVPPFPDLPQAAPPPMPLPSWAR